MNKRQRHGFNFSSPLYAYNTHKTPLKFSPGHTMLSSDNDFVLPTLDFTRKPLSPTHQHQDTARRSAACCDT